MSKWLHSRVPVALLIVGLFGCGDGGLSDRVTTPEPTDRPEPVNLSEENAPDYTDEELIAALIGAGPSDTATASAAQTAVAASAAQAPARAIIGARPFGGVFQVAIGSTPLEGFPAHGTPYIVVSSGDARYPTRNTNFRFRNGCRSDSLYIKLCDVGGLIVSVSVPQNAAALEFDYRYYAWEEEGREDPFRVALLIEGRKIGLAEATVSSEFGMKGSGLGWGSVHHLSADLSTYRGDTVQIRLQASDHLDFVMDAGALIANVRIRTNSPPRAEAGGPYSGHEGSPFAFDGGGSSDSDGDTLSFAWEFGDGGTAVTAAPSHVYADNGIYTATLTVADPAGASDTAHARVEVSNVAPTVRIEAEDTIYSGDTLRVSAPFTDPGTEDAPWSYTRDWGDGTVESGQVEVQSSPIAGAHRFLEARDYRIVLEVTDKDGGTGTDAHALTVLRLPVGIDIMPGSGENPIKFNPHGKLPVALLTTPGFDATGVDPETLTLGDERGTDTRVVRKSNGRLMASPEDVDGDGDTDVILHFPRAGLIDNADLTAATDVLVLLGTTEDGREIRGADSVRVIP